MRIALVIFSYYPAPTIGPVRHVAALSRGLAEKGHDVTIVTSTADVPPTTPLFEEIDGVKIERIPVAFRWGHWIRCPDLRLRLVKGRYDVFHTQLYRNYFTEATAKASRTSGVPIIITPRGSLLGYRYLNELPIYSIPNVIFDLLTRRRSLEGSVLVVTSKQEARDAGELGVPPERVKLIPHGLDFGRFPRSRPERIGDGTRLLCVGRIAEQRNVKFLLRGFALALRENRTLRLTIAGDPLPSRYNFHERGYGTAVRRLASRLGIEPNVDFLGGIYDDRLWSLYKEHDIFVYTARYDNFGHALVEAAYFGLPLVTTDVGVAADLIQRGRGGFLIQHDDDQALCNAILNLSSSDSLRFSCAGFLRQQSGRYELSRNVEAYEQLYQEVISGGQSHSV